MFPELSISTYFLIFLGIIILTALICRVFQLSKRVDPPDLPRKQFDVIAATKGVRVSQAYKEAIERDRRHVDEKQGMHERMKETLKVQPRQHRNGGGV